MMRYAEIIGGSAEDAEKKFPWLKNARFENAKIDIKGDRLVWHDGSWRDGIWYDGVWRDGSWYDGSWYDGIWYTGIWYDGAWHDGLMWDNVEKVFVKVVRVNNKFKTKR